MTDRSPEFMERLAARSRQEHPDRLQPGEPLGAGLRRITVHTLTVAIDGLVAAGDRDAGVHEARKALKRGRALLRLARDAIGYEVYRQENVVLRDVGRALAPVRDARVMVDTLDLVVDSAGDLLAPGAFAALRARLEDLADRRRREVLGDRQRVGDLVTTLRVARARARSWPVEPFSSGISSRLVIRDEFAAVRGGLRRTYRRGRGAMAAALAEPTGGAFHEWRKRVKYLRHQIETLEVVWPEAMVALSTALEALGELLGVEHDVTVLLTVADDSDLGVVGSRATLLRALAAAEREALRAAARPLGARLYSEAPGYFTHRIGAYWDAGRRTP